jgi:hypothetical protein
MHICYCVMVLTMLVDHGRVYADLRAQGACQGHQRRAHGKANSCPRLGVSLTSWAVSAYEQATLPSHRRRLSPRSPLLASLVKSRPLVVVSLVAPSPPSSAFTTLYLLRNPCRDSHAPQPYISSDSSFAFLHVLTRFPSFFALTGCIDLYNPRACPARPARA